jgi:hypothetical protein
MFCTFLSDFWLHISSLLHHILLCFISLLRSYTFVLAVVGHYRERLSPRLVTLIMRGTGSVLCLVGVGLGVSAALSYTSAAPATVPLKTAL